MSKVETMNLGQVSGDLSREQNIIREAQEEVWLVQETGSLLAETAKNELVTFLKRGGRVNAVVSAPTGAVARLMAFRNANLKQDAILQRSAMARAHLTDLQDQSGADAARLTVRYVPYPIAFTLALADPNHAQSDKRRGFARYAGFKSPLASKLGMALSGEDSTVAFQHFVSEAECLFLHSSKVIFLMGATRSGKTTALTKLVERVRPGEWLFWLLSPEVPDGNGGRAGFVYHMVGGKSAVRFANRQSDETYAAIDGSLREAIVAIGKARNERRVIVLDEIGPIQLAEPEFRAHIDELIADPLVTLIASLAEPAMCSPDVARMIEGLLRGHRATVLRLQRGKNFEQLLANLEHELNASATLHSQMPPIAWEN